MFERKIFQILREIVTNSFLLTSKCPHLRKNFLKDKEIRIDNPVSYLARNFVGFTHEMMLNRAVTRLGMLVRRFRMVS